jgi:hypothetical protein
MHTEFLEEQCLSAHIHEEHPNLFHLSPSRPALSHRLFAHALASHTTDTQCNAALLAPRLNSALILPLFPPFNNPRHLSYAFSCSRSTRPSPSPPPFYPQLAHVPLSYRLGKRRSLYRCAIFIARHSLCATRPKEMRHAIWNNWYGRSENNCAHYPGSLLICRLNSVFQT